MKETGGYAFPIPNADFQTFQPETIDEYKEILSGMTLRDYFASKAMQGILVNTERNHFSFGKVDEIASKAYELADAMLKARE